MQLAAILHQYHDAFQAKYSVRLLPDHLHAIDAISRCRTPEAGQLLVQCSGCGHTEWHPRSCGHRSCPQCQNHDTTLWLDRQQEKLLPVEYFLATFTLPYELRFLAWDNQILVYNLLFACASKTLKDFGVNPKNLGADIGSELALEIHAALQAAGIEIPFPQRDLHIRSVDAGVVAAVAPTATGPLAERNA